ncbi:hypothetical protein ABW21_db0206023 [Orbilia brochopaga]|nr:hypothetical protein ABW21_db0206023 [Drechslerella brochopaga]
MGRETIGGSSRRIARYKERACCPFADAMEESSRSLGECESKGLKALTQNQVLTQHATSQPINSTLDLVRNTSRPSSSSAGKNARGNQPPSANSQKICKACFLDIFESEIHTTIVENNIFPTRGERIAIGASGGKDSTVLASVLRTLNERYDYGVEFVLLSIDEGIHGYRDDSLETVKRNAVQYGMELCIVGYEELYGWTMDQVVDRVGRKGNCTYCGVFRRQALDRGAKRLEISHILTGHNADDVAETILMNFLRGDLPRLGRCAEIVTASSTSTMKRSKPLKYAYEKEIVLYAHHRKLDYFSTECVYSPEAFRGNARSLLKELEKVRPSSILDIVRSGEQLLQKDIGHDKRNPPFANGDIYQQIVCRNVHYPLSSIFI